MKHSQPKVHVIGAGVTGLTTALLLRMKGYDVTILAKDFPGDDNSESTVSCMAAGWKSLFSLTYQVGYDATSFKMFWDLARSHASEAGIMVVPAYDYYEKPAKDQKNPWWKHVVPGFGFLPKRELPLNVDVGYHFTTVLVNPQRYLQWLQSQYLTLGGKRKRLTLTHILEATMDDENNVDVIVNCTGVHARWLGGVLDKNIVPVRVQDTVVRASHIRKAVFIKWVDLNKAKETMERITALCPELTNGKSINELDVVAHVVGMNGRRQGGPRVDNEFIKTPSGKRILIIHNYGHAGSGYQSSWGSSKHAVRLVEEGYGILRMEVAKIRSLLSHL
ncbi:hypothetical protein DFQ29_009249 [Apophysomyces sp. BC1021]|nr:hypothetical protein DFQ29_009249 [Apophysomyces sp. BC1021]